MSTVMEVRETALYAPLTADATLMALLGVSGEYGGVYDEAAPEGAPFPYIVLGGTEESDARVAMGHRGSDGLENVRIHDRAAENERAGAEKVKEIYGHVYRILDRVAVDLGDYRLTNARMRAVTTFLEQDRRTVTMACQYTYRTVAK